MGVKSANQGYKVNGFIFPSKQTFQKLMDIDNIFKNLIDNYDSHNIRSNPYPSDSFDKMPKVKVKVIETYLDPCDELYGLFYNAGTCLIFQDWETSDYHQELYKLANEFFCGIEIVEY